MPELEVQDDRQAGCGSQVFDITVLERARKRCKLLIQKDLIQILVPLPPSCVALEELSNLSGPPFHRLCSGGDLTQLVGAKSTKEASVGKGCHVQPGFGAEQGLLVFLFRRGCPGSGGSGRWSGTECMQRSGQVFMERDL